MTGRLLFAAALAAACAIPLAPRPACASADGFKVTTDRTMDASSLDSIVRDAFRLSGARTNDEKAVALYDAVHATLFHGDTPVEQPPQTVGPLKLLNAYGWSLPGGEETVLKALFETAGWPVRYRIWNDPDHTATIETCYDDAWHYLDVFHMCYFWSKDKKSIAGQDEIVADPTLVTDGAKQGRVPPNSYLCCGADPQEILDGIRGSIALSPALPDDGWSFVTGRDRFYRPFLSLPAGASLRLEWKNEPGMAAVDGANPHACGIKEFENDKVLGPVLEHYGPRAYANGRLLYAPDFSKPADVGDIELDGALADGGKLAATDGKGQAIFKLALPYPFVSATLSATFEGENNQVSLSTDAGKTWVPIPGADLSPLVRQRYRVWLKVEFPGKLVRLALDAVVEHNKCALPYLLDGKNQVTVSFEKNKLPPGSVATVTYAYQEATAPAGRAHFDGIGLQYGETKRVTKEITSSPFTFTIDVGGNTPPKMLFLERAVRAQ